MPLPRTILHINHSRGWRGGERQTLLLARYLDAHEYRSHVCVAPGGELARQAEEIGLPLWTLRVRGELDFVAAFRLRRLLCRIGANLVHAHTAHAHGISVLALLGMPNIPLVVTRRVLNPIRKNALSAVKYQRCSKIIGLSHSICTGLVAQGIAPAKLVRIPSGIEVSRTTAALDQRPALRAQFGMGAETLVIGAVAAFTEEKGWDVLVEALRLVRAMDGGPYRALLVGDGPLRAAMQRRCATFDSHGHIVFTGHRPDAVALIGAMDIFVLASRQEGLGSSILDAMACGVAVIGTQVGGIPDMVHHERTGLLVAPGDSRGLAAAIARLGASAQLRRDLGTAGQVMVTDFDIKKTAVATQRVYNDIFLQREAGGQHRVNGRLCGRV